MQKFFSDVLIKVISDPKVQQFIKDLLSGIITEKIAPLVPLAAAAAVKAAFEQVPQLKELVDDIGNVVDVAEQTREELNKLIPDIDIGIPAIDSILDVWRPRG